MHEPVQAMAPLVPTAAHGPHGRPWPPIAPYGPLWPSMAGNKEFPRIAMGPRKPEIVLEPPHSELRPVRDTHSLAIDTNGARCMTHDA